MFSEMCLELIPISLIAILVRVAISLNLYSGAGKPPMYGDFEAQRHWMEVTYNLPAKDWYVNSTDNDLQYWGLDYPPLTAYHSQLCGFVANKLNSSWVALHSSRGLEWIGHKLFMRYTVVVADLMIFFPAVFLYFLKCYAAKSMKRKLGMILLTILYPGLVLIDHGHFQYNSISLGLFVWAVLFISTQHDCLGAIAFVLALNYKQMELYHAMPFFCYLLGSCFSGKELWLWKLIKIGVVVVTTFALCWFPFLEDTDVLLQVVHRIFPFARGLYEDKVANVWCSLSVLIKFKDLMEASTLIKLCLGSTVLSIFPSSLHLLLRPTVGRFKIALVNSSLAFFLFSFQVHEKSILIPALSVCMLFPEFPFTCVWFLMISTFSMLPLLIKEGLLIPYIASMILFYMAAELTFSETSMSPSPQHKTGKKGKEAQPRQSGTKYWPHTSLVILFYLSMMGATALTIASLVVEPPPHLPDIFPLLISGYSCGHFSLFLLYFNWRQFTCS